MKKSANNHAAIQNVNCVVLALVLRCFVLCVVCCVLCAVLCVVCCVLCVVLFVVLFVVCCLLCVVYCLLFIVYCCLLLFVIVYCLLRVVLNKQCFMNFSSALYVDNRVVGVNKNALFEIDPRLPRDKIARQQVYGTHISTHNINTQ